MKEGIRTVISLPKKIFDEMEKTRKEKGETRNDYYVELFRLAAQKYKKEAASKSAQ